MLAFDLDRREARWQCAAYHHMLGPDGMGRVVEIDEIACADTDRADAEANFVGVDSIEIDKPLERAFERAAVVIARRFERAGRLQPRDGQARHEKAGCAVHYGETGADLVRQPARKVAARWPARQQGRRDMVPEFIVIVGVSASVDMVAAPLFGLSHDTGAFRRAFDLAQWSLLP